MWNLKAMQLLLFQVYTNTKKEQYLFIFFLRIAAFLNFQHTGKIFFLQIFGQSWCCQRWCHGRSAWVHKDRDIQSLTGMASRQSLSETTGVAALRGDFLTVTVGSERFCQTVGLVVPVVSEPNIFQAWLFCTWWKTYLQPSVFIQVWPFRRGRLWPSLCGLHVSDLLHRPSGSWFFKSRNPFWAFLNGHIVRWFVCFVRSNEGGNVLCFFGAQFSWQRNTFILCVLNQLSQRISIQWWVKDVPSVRYNPTNIDVAYPQFFSGVVWLPSVEVCSPESKKSKSDHQS